MSEHLGVTCAWGQIRGTREYQEDAASVTSWPNGFHLLLLADGMGGHSGGARASQVLTNAMREVFPSAWREADGSLTRALVVALQFANLAIYEEVQRDPALAGMGSTLVAATIDGGLLEWLSVGDSPLLLFRGSNLVRLNADHSMAPELARRVAAGELSEQEARASPLRSQLLSAVNGDDIDLVDVSRQPQHLEVGDIVIVASDGLNALERDRLVALLDVAGKSPEVLAGEILEEIGNIEHRYLDNTTVIVARVEQTAALEKSETHEIKEPVS